MAEKNAPKDEQTAPDTGEAQVQAKVDEENEQGYRGVVPDPLDDKHYTVGGVLASDKAAEQDHTLEQKKDV